MKCMIARTAAPTDPVTGRGKALSAAEGRAATDLALLLQTAGADLPWSAARVCQYPPA